MRDDALSPGRAAGSTAADAPGTGADAAGAAGDAAGAAADLVAAEARLPSALLGLLPESAGEPQHDRFVDLMREYPSRAGKRLRGALVLRSTAAHGGSVDAALPVAAALELFQDWVLVHDDIEDDSDERRGGPTLHRMVGMPIALNVGDAMHVAMWRALLALPSRDGLDADAVRGEFVWAIERTARGQHVDLSWVAEGRFDVSEAEYLRMVRLKTAAYTVVTPLRLGAHVSGLVPHGDLLRIGEDLGAAFQIRDDVLNLLPGATAAYGKEFAGDLHEGKRTLVLAHLLAAAPPDEADEAVRRLAGPRATRTADDVAWLLGRIERHGSLRYAQSVAEGLAGRALADLREAWADLPDGAARDGLLHLLRSVALRDR